jgi:hypothetical protein
MSRLRHFYFFGYDRRVARFIGAHGGIGKYYFGFLTMPTVEFVEFRLLLYLARHFHGDQQQRRKRHA